MYLLGNEKRKSLIIQHKIAQTARLSEIQNGTHILVLFSEKKGYYLLWTSYTIIAFSFADLQKVYHSKIKNDELFPSCTRNRTGYLSMPILFADCWEKNISGHSLFLALCIENHFFSWWTKNNLILLQNENRSMSSITHLCYHNACLHAEMLVAERRISMDILSLSLTLSLSL